MEAVVLLIQFYLIYLNDNVISWQDKQHLPIKIILIVFKTTKTSKTENYVVYCYIGHDKIITLGAKIILVLSVPSLYYNCLCTANTVDINFVHSLSENYLQPKYTHDIYLTPTFSNGMILF